MGTANSTPVAFYTTANGGGAAAHFEHQDWLGTERMRTSYNGGVEGTYQSLPWGDGQSSSGSDQDAYHYATLDYDSESNTSHAQFRQYSSTEGRWLSPDPYGGSYDPANPQSFNRYEYAMDNPLSNIDPSGLDCIYVDEDGNYAGYDIGDCNNDTWGGGAGAYYIDCYGCLAGGVSNVSLTGDGGINFSMGDNNFYGDSYGNFSQVDLTMEGYPTQPLNDVISIDVGNEIILVPVVYPAGGGYPVGGGAEADGGGGGGAPNNAPIDWRGWWSCVSTGFRTLGSDLNPLDPCDSKFTHLMALAGAAQQGAAALSDASELAVGAHSVERGLTVPLRSNIVRAGLSNSEWLGDVAVGLSAATLVAAGADAAVAEWNQCVP